MQLDILLRRSQPIDNSLQRFIAEKEIVGALDKKTCSGLVLSEGLQHKAKRFFFAVNRAVDRRACYRLVGSWILKMPGDSEFGINRYANLSRFVWGHRVCLLRTFTWGR